ncbi:hypothetical protein [Hoylesella pleuritidis]|nr:hypothetical protein [Hoylesella pleuritidis]
MDIGGSVLKVSIMNGIYISRKHHKHNNPHFDAQPYLQNRWRLYVGG